MNEEKIKALVDLFLAWPLPKTVCSDTCACDPNYTYQRSGTNLMSADEAKQMFEYLFQEELKFKSLERISEMNMQESIRQFFKFDHLPPNLQPTSKAFHDLATTIVQYLPRNPERTVALRKLLEAKDCAVRAAIYK